MMDLEKLADLQTEAVNPKTARIDQLSTWEMCVAINREDLRVAPSITPCLPQIAATIDALAPRVQRGGRVVYVGAGTSGRLGILDASEIPPTFAAPPEQFVGIVAGGDAAIRRAQEGAEDNVSLGEADMAALGLIPELDSVIGIAASGRTPYVLGCLDSAKRVGCMTVGVVCSHPSAISQSGNVDFIISPLPGPEVVSGSTRLKAGTATKMALNMISTGIMIRIGKTFGNLMVDLVASNAKLRQRSRNILRRLSTRCASMSDVAVDSLLSQCNQSVKLAFLVAETGRSVKQCQSQLESAGGRLAEVLQQDAGSRQPEQPIISQTDDAGLVLCIDGGGSKTSAVIADCTGLVLGRGIAGSGNVTGSRSIDDVVDTITAAVNNALKESKISASTSSLDKEVQNLTQFRSIWVGLAGMDRPGFRDSLQAKLLKIFGCPPTLRLTNDVDILAATMARHQNVKSAVVLIAGTGSVAMKYNLKGSGQQPERVARSGGWGHVLGDEGGGYVIGLNAVKHTLTCLEEAQLGLRQSPVGQFEQAVLKGLGTDVTGVMDLLSAVLVGPPGQGITARIAQIAHVVLELAPTDPTALRIVSNQAIALVDQTLGRLVGLGSGGPVSGQEMGLILSGGILNQELYRNLVLNNLSDREMRFAYIETISDAATLGAQYLALTPVGC